MWKLAGVGVEFFGVFAVFVAGGWWLDSACRPNARVPVWTLVGAGLGFVAAMHHLITEATGRGRLHWGRPTKDQEESDDERQQ